MTELAVCPVCTGRDLHQVLEWRGVPALQNRVYATSNEARAAVRGTVKLVVCRTCTFTFNAAFDPTLASYGPGYDNCQSASPEFRRHQALVRRSIADVSSGKPGFVVEVGCGNGEFLRQLLDLDLQDWNGMGIDPSYTGERTGLNGRVRFVENYFNESYRGLRADILFSRHVIEHVPDPAAFVQSMVNCMVCAPESRVILETPSVAWTLVNHAFWDISYEHCSLFNSASIQVLFHQTAAQSVAVSEMFGGQYLMAEARRATVDNGAIGSPPECWAELVDEFSVGHEAWVNRFADSLEHERKSGRVAVWGAAGKGAVFCNRIDPDCRIIDVVFDNNPNKHGKYLPGTGHPICLPEDDLLLATHLIVVMNANYLAEISRQARAINPSVCVIAAEPTHRGAG